MLLVIKGKDYISCFLVETPSLPEGKNVDRQGAGLNPINPFHCEGWCSYF